MNAVVLTLLTLATYGSSAADIPKNHIGVGQTPKNEFVIYADPNVIGPDLPPEGTSSLFDSFLEYYWENNKVDPVVPYPLVELDRAVMSLGSGEGKVLGVLNPLTRGLSRPKSADKNLFATPRVLKTPDFGPKQSAKSLGLNLKNRLYYAYSELTDSLEILSINAKAGRWEFQEVLDYKKGATPKLVYSDRSFCRKCHQNGGPIFVEESRKTWHETNDNLQIASLIAKSLGGDYDSGNFYKSPLSGRPGPHVRFADLNYQGVKVIDPFSGTEEARALAYDTSTDISASFNYLQRIWVHRCGEGRGSNSCRRAIARVILDDIVFSRERPSLQTSAHYQEMARPEGRGSYRDFLVGKVARFFEKDQVPLVDYAPNLADRTEVEAEIFKISRRSNGKKWVKLQNLRIGEPFEKWITAKSLAEAFQEFECLQMLSLETNDLELELQKASPGYSPYPKPISSIYYSTSLNTRLRNIRLRSLDPNLNKSRASHFVLDPSDKRFTLLSCKAEYQAGTSCFLDDIPEEIKTNIVDLVEIGVIRVLLNASLKQRVNPGTSDFRTLLLKVLGPEVALIAEEVLLDYFDRNLDTAQLRQRAQKIFAESAPRLRNSSLEDDNLRSFFHYPGGDLRNSPSLMELDFPSYDAIQSFLKRVFLVYVDTSNIVELNPRTPQEVITWDLSLPNLKRSLGYFNDYFTVQDIELIKNKLPAVDSGDASAINKILDELSWSLTESIEQDVFQREVFMHDVLRGLRVRTEDLPARNDAYGVRIPKELKIDAVASGDRFQIRDPGLKRVQTYCGACHSGQHKEIAFLDGDSEENIVKNLGSLKDKIIKYLEKDADPMPPKRSDEHFELNGSVAEKSSLKAYILAL